MSRWIDPGPDRLYPQEQALLALMARVQVLEEALAAEVEAHRLTREHLRYLHTDGNANEARLARRIGCLQRDIAGLLAILEREE